MRPAVMIAVAGHPGHDPALAPRHRPAPLGGPIHSRQARPPGDPPEHHSPGPPAGPGCHSHWPAFDTPHAVRPEAKVSSAGAGEETARSTPAPRDLLPKLGQHQEALQHLAGCSSLGSLQRLWGRPGPRYGFRLWLWFRRGQRPWLRPGFRRRCGRLWLWLGRRCRWRHGVRQRRHWRLHWLWPRRPRARRFRSREFARRSVAGDCGLVRGICWHQEVIPRRAPAYLAAAAQPASVSTEFGSVAIDQPRHRARRSAPVRVAWTRAGQLAPGEQRRSALGSATAGSDHRVCTSVPLRDTGGGRRAELNDDQGGIVPATEQGATDWKAHARAALRELSMKDMTCCRAACWACSGGAGHRPAATAATGAPGQEPGKQPGHNGGLGAVAAAPQRAVAGPQPGGDAYRIWPGPGGQAEGGTGLRPADARHPQSVRGCGPAGAGWASC